MITVVVHYDKLSEPDIWFSITEKAERGILKGLRDKWDITRASSEDWYGQDIENYPVHHWNARKKQGL